MKNLRKEEIRNIYRKLTPYVASDLTWLMKEEKWLGKEIYEECGLEPTRISEIRHYKNYNKDVLNKISLIRLSKSGLINLKEMMEAAGLNEAEKDHLFKTIW